MAVLGICPVHSRRILRVTCNSAAAEIKCMVDRIYDLVMANKRLTLSSNADVTHTKIKVNANCQANSFNSRTPKISDNHVITTRGFGDGSYIRTLEEAPFNHKSYTHSTSSQYYEADLYVGFCS